MTLVRKFAAAGRFGRLSSSRSAPRAPGQTTAGGGDFLVVVNAGSMHRLPLSLWETGDRADEDGRLARIVPCRPQRVFLQPSLRATLRRLRVG